MKKQYRVLDADEEPKVGDFYWSFEALLENTWREVDQGLLDCGVRPSIIKREIKTTEARRQYACAALTGLIQYNEKAEIYTPVGLTDKAFEYADAMLAQEAV